MLRAGLPASDLLLLMPGAPVVPSPQGPGWGGAALCAEALGPWGDAPSRAGLGRVVSLQPPRGRFPGLCVLPRGGHWTVTPRLPTPGGRAGTFLSERRAGSAPLMGGVGEGPHSELSRRWLSEAALSFCVLFVAIWGSFFKGFVFFLIMSSLLLPFFSFLKILESYKTPKQRSVLRPPADPALCS